MNTLDTIIINLATELFNNGRGPVYAMFHGLCFVGGILMVVLGISRLPRAAAAGPMGMHNPYAGPFATIVVGILIMGIGMSAETLTESLFQNARSPIGYSITQVQAVGLGQRVNDVLYAIMQFVAFIGWCGVLRGLFLMKARAEGSSQAGVGTAMTHLIGGACAINLSAFLEAMEASLGMGNWIEAGLSLGPAVLGAA